MAYNDTWVPDPEAPQMEKLHHFIFDDKQLMTTFESSTSR